MVSKSGVILLRRFFFASGVRGVGVLRSSSDDATATASRKPSIVSARSSGLTVNRHSTVTHYQRPNMTHPQEGGTGGEVSEILFFSAKSKRRPSLIYSMQIIPVCLFIVARRKGVSATRRGGLNWTPISLLVGHPCKLFHTSKVRGGDQVLFLRDNAASNPG